MNVLSGRRRGNKSIGKKHPIVEPCFSGPYWNLGINREYGHQCDSELKIADMTIRCAKPAGHTGYHISTVDYDRSAELTWK